MRYDKNGNQWAIVSLETYSGNLQLYVFNNVYLKYLYLIKEDNIVFIRGKISNQSDNNRISQVIAETIFTADNIRNRLSRYLNVRFEHNNNKAKTLDQFSKLCNEHTGDLILILHMSTANKLNQAIQSKKYSVSSKQEFIDKLRLIFGKQNVWLS